MNWRPLLFSCLILAIKFYDDIYFWNIDVIDRVGTFTVSEMTAYENMITRLIDFNFQVKEKEFNLYYKVLKGLLEELNLTNSFAS